MINGYVIITSTIGTFILLVILAVVIVFLFNAGKFEAERQVHCNISWREIIKRFQSIEKRLKIIEGGK